MSAPRLGIALHPEPEFLSLAAGLIEQVDLLEVSPDMLWRDLEEPAPERALMLELVRRSGKPVLAHGLFLSLGSGAADQARWRAHLERARRDQADFGFEHYSDHSGFVAQGGRECALPLPVAFTRRGAAATARRLRELAEHAPRVALENSASLVFPGGAEREPAFLRAVLEDCEAGLVLDLHNAYANCVNAGLDLGEWLARVPCERVVELHLSGGSWSEPEWGARRLRLDTHDGPIPEEVWAACAEVLPRCSALGAVVLERIGLLESELEGFSAELERARRALSAWTGAGAAATDDSRELAEGPDPDEGNALLLDAVLADDPAAALEAGLRGASPDLRAAYEALDEDGLRVTRLIVKRLRFERIVAGDAELRRAFADDPAAFTERFRAYDAAAPSSTPWPQAEARAFRAFEG